MKKNRKYHIYTGIFLAVITDIFNPYVLQAAELSIESNVDKTPTELRQLSVKAASLESKIRELERRIAETQNVVVGAVQSESIDFRLDLVVKDTKKSQDQISGETVVSHVRMSLNGRPFLYNQSAVVVSEQSPLPLFLGKLPAGQYQLRLQFQTAQLTRELATLSRAPWVTVDRVINIEVSAAGGRQQFHTIPIHLSEAEAK